MLYGDIYYNRQCTILGFFFAFEALVKFLGGKFLQSFLLVHCNYSGPFFFCLEIRSSLLLSQLHFLVCLLLSSGRRSGCLFLLLGRCFGCLCLLFDRCQFRFCLSFFRCIFLSCFSRSQISCSSCGFLLLHHITRWEQDAMAGHASDDAFHMIVNAIRKVQSKMFHHRSCLLSLVPIPTPGSDGGGFSNQFRYPRNRVFLVRRIRLHTRAYVRNGFTIKGETNIR